MMRIVAVVGALALIVAGLMFGWAIRDRRGAELAAAVEHSYQWVPPFQWTTLRCGLEGYSVRHSGPGALWVDVFEGGPVAPVRLARGRTGETATAPPPTHPAWVAVWTALTGRLMLSVDAGIAECWYVHPITGKLLPLRLRRL